MSTYFNVIVAHTESQVRDLQLGSSLNACTRVGATDWLVDDLLFFILIIEAVVLPHTVGVSSVASVALH